MSLRFVSLYLLLGSLRTANFSSIDPDKEALLADFNKPRLSVLLATGYFPGHLYPITALGAELVKRGHNVTLCATVMEGSDLLPELPESYGIKFVSAGPDNLTQADYDNMVKQGRLDNASLSDIWKFIEIAQWPSVKIRSKIDEIGDDQFDIIVSDGSVSPVGVYYSLLGRRSVVLTPLYLCLEATCGYPSTSSTACLSDNLCFLERFGDLILHNFLRWFQGIVFSGIGNIDAKFAEVLKGKDITSHIGISVPMLMATAFGFEYPKTRYPLTHYVGPLMMDSFPPLEHQLVEWLNKKTNKTVIYVGMGATGSITADMAKVIIDGILATDFSAVWALPMSDQSVLEGMDIDEEKFYISKWIPRQTLFKHPTLVITILHCGMNGVLESLYNGLPVVCVPHGFDHFDVAGKIEHTKVGIPLYSMIESFKQGTRPFTPENITAAINATVTDRTYGEQAKKMREVFMFAGGAKRASDLVEFYAEVGYDHLIPAYVKYEWSWVQYYNLDVHCLLLLTTSILLYSTYKLLKCCSVKCCSPAKKSKTD